MIDGKIYCVWCQMKPATVHYIRNVEVFNADTGQDLDRSTTYMDFCADGCRDAYFFHP
jgi:hypothetical protein